MSELYLTRHGQASFASDNYDQLSDIGYDQSRLLGGYFRERGIKFDHLIAGTMQRHQQTLDGICEGLTITKPDSYRSHPGFNEYDFKSLVASFRRSNPGDDLVQLVATDTRNKKNFYRLLRQVLTAWCADNIEDVPETYTAFQLRVKEAKALLHKLAVPGERILVVSSGGAISQFIGWVLNLDSEKVFDLNLQMRNTGVTHFYFNSHKIRLSWFNGVPHLDHPERETLITYG